MHDVVVIGGGIVGLLCAAELGELGMSVLLVEKDDLGFEQTGRSTAAIRLPRYASASAADGTDSVPALAAREWDGFEQRWEGSVELDRGGWFTLAVDAADQRWLDAQVQTLGVSEHVADEPMLTATAARERYPALAGPFQALYPGAGGHVNRTLVLKVLEQAARRRGTAIRVGTIATGFERSGGRVVAVETTSGRIPCGAAVVAAGVWTSRLCDRLGLRIPLQRVRVPTGETGPVAEKLIPGFVRAGKLTARQNADGTIRVGGGFRAPEYIHDLSLDDLRDLRIWGPAFLGHLKGATMRVDRRIVRHDLARLLGRERDVVPTAWEPRPWRAYSRQKLQNLAAVVPALRGARIHRFS